MRKRLTYEFVKESFEKEGYILLSERYINAHVKLRYICSKGHKHTIDWDHWQRGKKCPYCAGNGKLTISRVKQSFKKEGYILLSEGHINNKQKLDYICSMGHRHSVAWYHWKQGNRCPTCHKLNLFGSGNPSWNGGKSFEPYCSVWKDLEYKEDIKERDSYKCLNPCCDSPNKKDLAIHHVDYNKKNCGPRNLITVCRSCNSKANSDRIWHKAWYQAILNKRYDYNY